MEIVVANGLGHEIGNKYEIVRKWELTYSQVHVAVRLFVERSFSTQTDTSVLRVDDWREVRLRKT